MTYEELRQLVDAILAMKHEVSKDYAPKVAEYAAKLLSRYITCDQYGCRLVFEGVIHVECTEEGCRGNTSFC
jgi:hypothetical protein